MLRNRLVIVLGVSFLAASATRADNLGYINCSGHPDETPVFAKARQTRETVASLQCGERFTVILYGFIFSRIQTADGKIGYVYSNLITVGAPQAPVQQSTPAPARTSTASAAPAPATPTASLSVRGATISDGSPSSTAVTQPQPALAQSTSTQAPPAASPAPASPLPKSTLAVTAVVQPSPATPAQSQPAPVQPAPTQSSLPAPATPPSSAGVLGATITGVLPPPPTILTGPQPSSAEPVPAERPAPASPAPASAVSTAPAPPSPAATSTPPEAAPSEQPNTSNPEPQPEPAQPVAPAIRPAKTLDSWERPNPGGRRTPLIELFGGYAFARMDGGAGTFTNMHGALGSFGWNANSWLQVVADTSYNVLTVNGTKTVLYGNHYGPRIYYRRRNRWGLTPFVEGLIGGSRADTTTSGIKTSVNTISFKAGGGLDIKPTRHVVIRLLNVDYYRTSFGGSNVHENNYWASAGIVLRLFGGSE